MIPAEWPNNTRKDIFFYNLLYPFLNKCIAENAFFINFYEFLLQKKTCPVSRLPGRKYDLIKADPYIAVYPPSTGRFTPVTYDDAGDARKMVAVSSSPSIPYLSSGIIVFAFCWKNSELSVSSVRGV